MTKYTKEIKLAIYHEWVDDHRRGTYLSRKYGMGRGGIQYLVDLDPDKLRVDALYFLLCLLGVLYSLLSRLVCALGSAIGLLRSGGLSAFFQQAAGIWTADLDA
nr:hypothetical protein [Lactobacillus delbrueckii]